MFRLIRNESAAQSIFAHAARLLGGRDPRDLVSEADQATLHENAPAQILCCTQMLAAFSVLRPVLPRALVVAGYSVGEWAAWCVAGCLEPGRTLDLVRLRARLMDEASGVGGGLVAIRGLSRSVVEALCDSFAAAVAIVNPGELYIVGGHGPGLERLRLRALELGAARATRLSVNTPAHTPRLAAAVKPLRDAIETSGPVAPPVAGTRLISGLDGRSIRGTTADIATLAAQVARPLDWEAALRSCAEAGMDRVLELGPGTALADMARAALPHVDARGLDEFQEIDGVRRWLARGGN